jgi:tetratricopeptide (TPR) repeat protein
MRVIFIPFVLSFLIGCPAREVSAQQADIRNERSRVALVIGNASYPSADPGLTQPISNARALGEELRYDGFQVNVGENLTKEAMQRAFSRLYDQIKPGTVALVFFSGFGIQSNNWQSYMIPVDAQIYKEDDVHHDGISVDKVLSDMDKRGAAVKIVILDASRRNRLETNFRPAPKGLALPANPPSGTLIMYSAGSGSVVPDSGDRNLFVSELLKEMRVPGVSADEVFNHTRIGVLHGSGGKQLPANYTSLNEEFIFGPDHKEATVMPPAGVPPPPVPPPAPTPPVVPTPPRVDPDKALKDLDKYIGENPDDPAAFYRRGQLYGMMNDFPSAIKDFDKSLRLHPKDAEALNNRCWAHAMVGDSQAALKDCNEALQLRPDYADALDSRGFVKLKIGEPSSAIADYDAALQIKKQASSFYGRGLAKKQTGDSAGGEGDIAAAKAIDPSIGAEFERSGLQ